VVPMHASRGPNCSHNSTLLVTPRAGSLIWVDSAAIPLHSERKRSGPYYAGCQVAGSPHRKPATSTSPSAV
jgi:hypothetical protein